MLFACRHRLRLALLGPTPASKTSSERATVPGGVHGSLQPWPLWRLMRRTRGRCVVMQWELFVKRQVKRKRAAWTWGRRSEIWRFIETPEGGLYTSGASLSHFYCLRPGERGSPWSAESHAHQRYEWRQGIVGGTWQGAEVGVAGSHLGTHKPSQCEPHADYPGDLEALALYLGEGDIDGNKNDI